MILDRPKLVSWLDRCSFLLGLAAAGFWWWSAAIPLPTMQSYFDQAPETDPFLMAIRHSSNLNAVAALLTGLSVALAALTSWVRSLQRWPPGWMAKI